MKKYILKRLLLLIPVLIGVSILIFVIVRLTPGDPARILAGEHATEEYVQATRERWGLDKPMYVQYYIWFKSLLRGDLGRSITTHSPVVEEIFNRFPATLELSLFAMFLAIVIGILAGIISAIRQYHFFDYFSMTVALFGISMPVFWLGLMLMFVFGLWLDILPISGRINVMIPLQNITGLYVLDSILTLNFQALGSSLLHLILPSIALGTIPMAMIARITRSSMLEIIRQDFIRTERAKGLPERMVIFKHALKNALIPIITVIGMEFGLLLGGAILTETVFAWPGLGRYTVDAVYARDYPAIQGSVLFIAFIFVVVNLITDVLYAYINPRIRYH
ncbi:MAG TPA: ABC transporter permease [Atribacter sp.]|jgi:peptide/nickel transport system permease protein|uniref:Dipeptide transport system permease protein DppB n=1 Tax=Candidatus Atribacter allofermentans TaxID=1852833 RepID=A0A1V5SHV3_9BACT|nr:ABC transporter permease [Atribacter sp.]MDD3714697.1 ABC transporter permease [Atribacterota bacterium]MDI9593933.1 ABC transporter permease [Atribacterota bacterium]OQA54119.1 MAG: Dipeptide transport system permease protein DppB [Candidatus Atribacteria bacterium ADurb.Bin276]HQK84459.1 ABC transporter permease [Atribacter sp.]